MMKDLDSMQDTNHGCCGVDGMRSGPGPTAAPPAASQVHPPGLQQFQQQQYELLVVRLQRERDEAVEQAQLGLRQAHAAATAAQASAEGELAALRREHAALHEAHAVAALAAQQAAASASAELASRGAQLERLAVAQAEEEARRQQAELRADALAAQQAVLLECYRALESERGTGSSCRRCGPTAAAAAHGQLALALPWEGSDPPPVEQQLDAMGAAQSQSHLGLALTVAELQRQLQKQRGAVTAAAAAAAAAQEEAAGLWLLLARQQAWAGADGGGAAAALEQRLEVACRRVEEAQEVGARLRELLAQVSSASLSGGCCCCCRRCHSSLDL